LVISYWANRYPENVDVWWPEITEGLPVTEESQVKVAIGLIGKIIVTVSPIIILTMLREVRLGRMSYMDLNIYCNGKSIDVWPEGEIDTWPGGFSMTRGHLLFDDN
jgi:hypothetical protein